MTGTMIILNVVGAILSVIVAGYLGDKKRPGTHHAWGAFIVSIAASIAGWSIYIIVASLAKVW